MPRLVAAILGFVLACSWGRSVALAPLAPAAAGLHAPRRQLRTQLQRASRRDEPVPQQPAQLPAPPPPPPLPAQSNKRRSLWQAAQVDGLSPSRADQITRAVRRFLVRPWCAGLPGASLPVNRPSIVRSPPMIPRRPPPPSHPNARRPPIPAGGLLLVGGGQLRPDAGRAAGQLCGILHLWLRRGVPRRLPLLRRVLLLLRRQLGRGGVQQGNTWRSPSGGSNRGG